MPSSDKTVLRLQRQRYYSKNKEKVLVLGRKHDSKRRNSEARKQYMRQWWANHKDKQKAYSEKARFWNDSAIRQRKKDYYQRNKERIKAKSRKRYQDNKAELLLKFKDYAAAHPEKLREYQMKYRSKNAVRLRDYNRVKAKESYHRNIDANRIKACARESKKRASISFRAKVLGCIPDASSIAKFMQSVRENQNARCAYCGKPLYGEPIHFDHVIPLSKGGNHSVENMCAACPLCNLRKKDKTPDEFSEYLKTISN